jgi:glycosyltransferase involved in cell wall biosynthesis
MATGLPVVVSDIPSNREWVNEGENGWLIDGSPKDFAEKLLTSAHLSPQQREKISGLNQSIVASRADWDRNFPLLSNLYERLRKFH